MVRRVSFKSNKIRDLFFERVLKHDKMDTWKDLSLNFNIPRVTLSRYRSGELTLPESIYNNLISEFLDKDIAYLNKNISYLDDNWGRVKGGHSTYSKYKHIFDKGRKKALKKKREKIHKFDTNLVLNKELAYFIGLFIGDGFTNKYSRYYLTQFVGHFPIEEGYYRGFISSLSKKLFRITPTIRRDKDSNALRINLYSKDLFN